MWETIEQFTSVCCVKTKVSIGCHGNKLKLSSHEGRGSVVTEEDSVPGWGDSRMPTPKDKGHMLGNWNPPCLKTWRLWREDSRRQAPCLPQRCGREFGFHPVVNEELSRICSGEWEVTLWTVDEIKQSCNQGDILLRSFLESSGEVMVLRSQLRIWEAPPVFCSFCSFWSV